MRYRFVILFLLACNLLANAQDRDNILAKMNAVKLDPGCVYGYCAFSNANFSRTEALADLASRVEAYMKSKGFKHVHTLADCPEGTVRTLVYTKGSDYFRTVAYVDKAALERLESELSKEYEVQGYQRAISALKERLARVTTYGDLEALLADSGAGASVRRGALTFDTPQDDVDRGFLVYYDKKTGKITAVMTPRNGDGVRFDVKTGAPGHPRKAPQGVIEWVCFEEPTKM